MEFLQRSAVHVAGHAGDAGFAEILHPTWIRVICGSQAALKETNARSSPNYTESVCSRWFLLAPLPPPPTLPGIEFRNLAVSIGHVYIYIYICPVSDICCDNFRRWNENARANVALMLNLRYSTPLYAVRRVSHSGALRNPVCRKRGRFCIFMPHASAYASYVLSVKINTPRSYFRNGHKWCVQRGEGERRNETVQQKIVSRLGRRVLLCSRRSPLSCRALFG